MTLELVNHVDKGLERIIDKLKKENFEKFVSVYLEESQELEEVFLKLAEQKSIDLAEGVWLDYIGKIVGLQRNGMSDEEYRIALRIKISINRSDGTPDIMMDLIAQITEAESVQLREGSIAWGTIKTNGRSSIGNPLWTLVDQIKPAGTRWLTTCDYEDNAFQPAWRIRSKVTEAFNTTDEGTTYEGFDTTNDGVTYERFYTQDTRVEYDPASYSDKAILSWRLRAYYLTHLEDFFVHSHGSFEEFLADIDDVFQVLVRSGSLWDKEQPVCWRVTDQSKTIEEG